MPPPLQHLHLFLTSECLYIDWKTSRVPFLSQSDPGSRFHLMKLHVFYDTGLENLKWNLCERACVLGCAPCTHFWGSEGDSKCHFIVWGQPSQMHLSCRRCCHPPPHCLCKWCLQSASNTWRFHPPSVTLSLLLRLHKLSCRPSAPAAARHFFPPFFLQTLMEIDSQ